MNLDHYKQYKSFLPGLKEECPEEFIYLAQLFKEQVFELLEKKEEKQYFVVYMMNDAIESFLVFDNAVLTGEYENDNEDTIEGSLDRIGEDYMLIVRQGESNTFTIRFSKLKLENNLYQYHNIGHFWVKGDEYLRQITYRLGILQDKYAFLGDKVCNQEELTLLSFYEFAPLRNYISVSWEKQDKFISTERGIDAFLELAKEVKDTSLEKLLIRYKKQPSKRIEWMLTKMLKMVKHKRVIDLLRNKIDQASRKYKERSFTEEENQLISYCRKRLEETLEHKYNVTILEEQPFSIGEEFSYSFHILQWKDGWIFRKVHVYSIVLKGNNLVSLKNVFDKRLQGY
ncbi:DUF3878 family protein [Anaerosporobacter sp.]